MSELTLQQKRAQRREESNVNLDLTTAHLDKGSHNNPEEGYCLMEAVSIYAGEPFSETPDCVPVTLEDFGAYWNDILDDQHRQHLIRLIPKLAYADASNEAEVARVWTTLDWLLFDYLPMWMCEAGLDLAGWPLSTLRPFDMSRYEPIAQTLLDIGSHAFEAKSNASVDLRSVSRKQADAELGHSGWRAAKGLIEINGLTVMADCFDERNRLFDLIDVLDDTAQRVAELAVVNEVSSNLDHKDRLALSAVDQSSLLPLVDQHAAGLRFRLRPACFRLLERLVDVEAPEPSS